MRIFRSAALIATGVAFLSLGACAKHTTAAAEPTSGGSAVQTEVSSAATDQAPEQSVTTAATGTVSSAASSGDTATATTVSAAPRPWYADSLEKLGFYVFPAPVDVGDFTVESAKGGSMSLSKEKGKIVLLNFWATWCPPCRAEMPSIQALWDKRKDKDFAIIAVSVGEQKDTVDKFIADNKYSYPIYLDPTGRLGSAFNASSIPTTYIIGKDGKVIAGTQGGHEYDSPEVIAAFDELMAK